MYRMGHAGMRAALIYQHATSERDRQIADGMDRRISGTVRKKKPKKKGKPEVAQWHGSGMQDQSICHGVGDQPDRRPLTW
jgi:hypothetical protein